MKRRTFTFRGLWRLALGLFLILGTTLGVWTWGSSTAKLAEALSFETENWEISLPSVGQHLEAPEAGVKVSSAQPLGDTRLTVQRESRLIEGRPTIKRAVGIHPEQNEQLSATLTFQYHESELNGIPEEQLVLYSSQDEGITWQAHRNSRVDAEANTITVDGLGHFSLWTAAAAPPALQSSSSDCVDALQSTDATATGTSVVSSGICLLCSVSNTANLIDADTANFATITTLVGVGSQRGVGVDLNPAAVPTGSQVGFVFEDAAGILDVVALGDNLRIRTLNNGNVVDDGLLSNSSLLSVQLLGGSSTLNKASIMTTGPIDEVQFIVDQGLVSLAATFRVHYAYIEVPCPPAPGGVLGALNFWVKAEVGTGAMNDGDPVQVWEDQSPNGFNVAAQIAARRPTYKDATSASNFNPTVLFNGSSNSLRAANFMTGAEPGGSVYGAAANGSPGSGFDNLICFGVDNPHLGTAASSGRPLGYMNGSSPIRNDHPAIPVSNQFSLWSWKWDMALNPSNTNSNTGLDVIFNGWVNEAPTMEVRQSSFANGGALAKMLTIGGYQGVEIWDGPMGEIAIYARNLTPVEDQRVSSYFSIRWGTTLDDDPASPTVNYDYLDAGGNTIWPGTADASYQAYHNGIAGIGRDDASALSQKQSRSVVQGTVTAIYNGDQTGGLPADNAANMASFAADASFLLWGHNGQAASYSTAYAPNSFTVTGSYFRTDRAWRVAETGDVGTVTVHAPSSAQHLIVHNSADFDTGTPTEIALVDDGNGNKVAAYDFADGDYFAFGREIFAPGCVSNGLRLWMKADGGLTESAGNITAWEDASGNDNNPTPINAPGYLPASMNFNPSVSFNGTNQRFDWANFTSGFAEGEIFYLLKSNRPKTVSNGFAAWGNDHWQHYTWGNQNIYDAFGSTTRANFVPPWDILLPNIYNTRAKPGQWTAWHNGAQVYNQNSNTIRFNQGATNLGFGNYIYYAGEIPEVILYDRELTAAEKEKVNSYLAIKYGQTLAHNYVTSSGATIYDASSHNNRVTGIGREDCQALHQKQSLSAADGAQITIGVNSQIAESNADHTGSIDNENFLVFGDDDADGWDNNPFPVAPCFTPEGIDNVYNRRWKITETGDVEAVLMQVPAAFLAANVSLTQPVYLAYASNEALTADRALVQGIYDDVNEVVNFNIDWPANATRYFTFSGTIEPNECVAACEGGTQYISPGKAYGLGCNQPNQLSNTVSGVAATGGNADITADFSVTFPTNVEYLQQCFPRRYGKWLRIMRYDNTVGPASEVVFSTAFDKSVKPSFRVGSINDYVLQKDEIEVVGYCGGVQVPNAFLLSTQVPSTHPLFHIYNTFDLTPTGAEGKKRFWEVPYSWTNMNVEFTQPVDSLVVKWRVKERRWNFRYYKRLYISEMALDCPIIPDPDCSNEEEVYAFVSFDQEEYSLCDTATMRLKLLNRGCDTRTINLTNALPAGATYLAETFNADLLVNNGGTLGTLNSYGGTSTLNWSNFELPVGEFSIYVDVAATSAIAAQPVQAEFDIVGGTQDQQSDLLGSGSGCQATPLTFNFDAVPELPEVAISADRFCYSDDTEVNYTLTLENTTGLDLFPVNLSAALDLDFTVENGTLAFSNPAMSSGVGFFSTESEEGGLLDLENLTVPQGLSTIKFRAKSNTSDTTALVIVDVAGDLTTSCGTAAAKQFELTLPFGCYCEPFPENVCEGNKTLNWRSFGPFDRWDWGTRSKNYDIGDQQLQVTVTDEGSPDLMYVPPWYPVSLGNYLYIPRRDNQPDSKIITRIKLMDATGTVPLPAEAIDFRIKDIDGYVRGQDVVTVTGKLNGVDVMPILATNPVTAVTITPPNMAQGSNVPWSWNLRGDLYVNFESKVDEIIIEYTKFNTAWPTLRKFNDLAIGHINITCSKPVPEVVLPDNVYVFKEVSPNPARQGEAFTYKFTLMNTDCADKTVNLNDVLPANLTWADSSLVTSLTYGTVNMYGGTATLDLSSITLPVGISYIYADALASADGDFDNQASFVVNGNTYLSDEPNIPGAANPTPVTILPAQTADLEVTKAVDKIIASQDSVVQYTFTIQNNEAVPVSTFFTDALDQEATFVDGSLSGVPGAAIASAYGGEGAITIRDISVPAGGSVSFTIEANMNQTEIGDTVFNQAIVVVDENSMDTYLQAQYLSNTVFTEIAGDTDGDGVNDDVDPDPNDPCVPVQSPGYTGYDPANPIWAAADCDGDGISNGDEHTNGTDPYESCDPMQSPGYTGYDPSNAIWAAADCDGDGTTNGDEDTNGSDPYSLCDPDNPIAISGFTPAAPAFCTGSDVPVTVNATISTGTITSYDWTVPGGGNASGATITAALAGDYTVTITSSDGCTQTGMVTVTEQNGPTAAEITGTITMCTGATTDLVVNVTGGTSPYTVVLSSGDIIVNYISGDNIPVSPTASTTYTIASLTDANGCGAAAPTGTAEVAVLPSLDAGLAVGDAGVCLPAMSNIEIPISNSENGVMYELRDLADMPLTPAVTVVGNGGTVNLEILPANAPATTTTYKVFASAHGCTDTELTDQSTVSIEGPVSISGTIADQTLCGGSGTTFTVSYMAEGSEPFFQWQYRADPGDPFADVPDDAVFDNPTTATLTINNVTGLDGHEFQVVLDKPGCGGAQTSNIASLTVEGPISISAQPVSMAVCSGEDATFTVAAVNSGAGTLEYQWERSTDNGASWTDIGGATMASYTVSGATSVDNNHRFRLKIFTDNCATVTSNAAILVVEGPIAFPTQPVSQTVCEGPVTFTAAVSSGLAGTPEFQWQVFNIGTTMWDDLSNTPPYSGVTTEELTIADVTGLNGLQYRLMSTTPACAVGNASDVVTLTVEGPINITADPADDTVCSGDAASFSATAGNAGAGTLQYQWQISTNGGVDWNNLTDGGVYSGATTAALNISNSAGLNGAQYRVNLSTDECAAVSSASATLSVEGPLTVGTNPSDDAACAGEGASFTAAIDNDGSGTLLLQWQISTDNGATWNNLTDGGVYSGTQTATLAISDAVGLNGRQYRMQATTAECSTPVQTAAGILTVEGPVGITLNPSGAQRCAGDGASFVVVGSNTGGGTLLYQWQLSTDGGTSYNDISNGGVYSGATTDLLEISDVTGLASNRYRARVYTNGCATGATSTGALLQVEGELTFSANPADVAVCSGSSASFTATANNAGSGIMSVRWQVSTDGGTTWNDVANGGVYSGATTGTLNISDVAGLGDNQYRLTAFTPVCPAVASSAATLTVEGPLAVTTEPSNLTACTGEMASFTVAGDNPGSGTVLYQWQRFNTGTSAWEDLSDAGVYSGTATATLSISDVAGLNGEQYRAVLSTTVCTAGVNSAAATLSVNGPFNFSVQPADQTLCTPTATTFTATASDPGGSTILYRWEVSTDNGTSWNLLSNSGVYAGTTSAVLIISNTTGLDGNQYRVRAYTATCAGGTYSDAALLNVEGQIMFTTSPAAATLCAGASTTLTAAVSNAGGGTVAYQWQVSTDGGATWNDVSDGGIYAGAATAELSISDVAGLNSNQYRVQAETSACSPITSSAAALTVEGPLAVTTQPDDLAGCAGDNASFSITATNGSVGAILYQWQISTDGGTTWNDLSDGGAISGANTSTLSLSDIEGANGHQYRCHVTTTACTAGVFSDAASLLTEGPLAASAPTSIGVCAGADATFNSTVTNPGDAASMTLQWQVSTDGGGSWADLADAGVYSGASTSTLAISDATGLDGNQYRIKAGSDECSDVFSMAATLTVEGPLSIMGQPVDVDVCSSTATSFSVTASNAAAGTLLYQWEVSTDNGATWAPLANGGVYSNVDAATLDISDVAGLGGNQYRALVSTAACGTGIYSDTAALTVEGPFSISLQPMDEEVCSGEPAVFSATATNTGSGGLFFQWQESVDGGTTWNDLSDGGVFSGTATNTLSIGNSAGLDGNQYRLELSSQACDNATAATTSAAFLTVNAAAPTADAGSDLFVCGTVNSVNLADATVQASATNGAVSWATSGTGNFIDPNATLPVYQPSAADKTAGSVTLTMVVTGASGTCGATAAQDEMSITFDNDNIPEANAGPDITVCTASLPIYFAALEVPPMASNGTVFWTKPASVTGTFDDVNVVTPIFTPSAADIANGSVTLTLTVVGDQGECVGVQRSDAITITLSTNNVIAAEVSGTADICEGKSTDISILITGGEPPYTIIYTDGTNSFQVDNYEPGDPIAVAPSTTTTYALVSVEDAINCPKIDDFGGTATITVHTCEALTIDPIFAGEMEITGTGEPGADVTVTLPDGTDVTTTVEPDGTWSVISPDPLEAGDEVTAVQTVFGQDDDPVTATVNEAPAIDPIFAGDTEISGTGEPGADITVTLPDGTEVMTTVDPDGTWSVTSPDPLEAGEEVTAVQTIDGEESDPVMATVNEGQTIDPIFAGDTEISGTGEPGADITVTLPDGTEVMTTVDPDGTWSVTSPDPLEAGDEVTAVQTIDGEESDPVMATVNEAQTIDPIFAGDTEISGTGEPGADITVTLPDGTEVMTTVDPDGTWSVTSPDPLEAGDEVTAVQTVDGEESDPVMATVNEAPAIDPIFAGDTEISGTGEPGADITVTLPDGTEVMTTVDPDGTWSVTSPDPLEAGEEVTAVQTIDGEESDPVMATVNEGQTIDPIFAGDTEISGTGEPGADITVTLPDGTEVMTTVDPDGTWSVTSPDPLEAGDEVTAVQTVDGEESDPVMATVNEAPAIDPVFAGDTEISGTGEPGADITVTLPDGTEVMTTVDPDGTWSVTSPDPLEAGDMVTAVQTIDGEESDPVTATVNEGQTIDPIFAGDTEISGTGEPGADITVTLPDGTEVMTTVDPDGTWSVTSPDPLEAGDEVTAVQTIDGEESDPVMATVNEAQTIDPIFAGDTEISGTGEPGADITVTLPDGTEVMTTVDPDGTWSVTSPDPLEAGDMVTAVQTIDGEESDPVMATVNEAQTIDPIFAGDTEISGTGEPGADITVTLPDGTEVMTTVDPDGTWSVTSPDPLEAGDEVTAVQTIDGEESDPVMATVNEAPAIDPVFAGDTEISGTGEPGADITVTLPDGTEVMTTVDPDGTWSVTSPDPLVAGDMVTAVQTIDGEESDPVTATVNEGQTIDPIFAGDTEISGTGEPGADITVTLPDGTEVMTTVDPDGTWSVTSPDPLEAGDEVTAVQTIDGEESDPVMATVNEAPAIDPVFAGDTEISGTGEPGADITVTLPDGTEVMTTVDPDGTWSVTSPDPLEAGDEVTAVQTVDGEESDPVTATVNEGQTIDPIFAGDTEISGTGEPGADVTVTLPDGTEVMTTVDPDGTWSVTSPDPLEAGDMVTAVQTVDGEESDPVTATVNEGQTIDPIFAGDTEISGTGEPGADVTVTLPDGTEVMTTVDPDGTWSVTSPDPLEAGDEVTAVQTIDGEESDPVTATVNEGQTIDPIFAGDTEISGTGEPGADITVTLPDGTEVMTTVDPDGTWSVTSPDPLEAGDEVTAVQTIDGEESDPVTATVNEAPAIDPIFAGDTEISGTGEPGADITVTLPDGTEVMTTVDPDGTWSVTSPDPLEAGDEVTAVQTVDGEESDPVMATVNEGQTIDPIFAGDTEISGTGEPGADITVTLPDGTEVMTTVDPDGTWSVTSPDPLEAGEEVTVVQTVDGEESDPVTATVNEAPAIDPIFAGDTEISGTGEPGADITVTLPDGMEVMTTVDPDGTWSVTSPDPLEAGEEVTVVQTIDGEESDPVTATVNEGQTIDPIFAGDTEISGTGEPGADVTVTLPDGTEVMTTVDPDGTWSVTSPDPLEAGEEVTVVQTIDGEESDPVMATVNEAQTIDPIFAGDTEITGTGEPGADITVTLPDGTEVMTTVDPDGTWSVTSPDPLEAGDEVTAVQTIDGEESDPVMATVNEGQTIDPIFAGDTEISGTGEPGADITVTLPDGTEVMTTVDPDGTWSVTSPDPLEAGDEVTAVQTVDGEESDPVTATVNEGQTIDPIFAGDTEISGTGEPGADITVTLPDGTEVMTTVDPDGTWSVTSPDPLEAGEEVTVVQTVDGEESDPVMATVNEGQTIDPIFAGDTEISGTGEPGADVTVTLPDGTEVMTTVDPDGTWSVTSPDPLEAGDMVTAVQTIDGEESDPVTATVNDGQTIDPIVAGDTEISGTGEPGAEITVTLPDGTEVTTTVDPDGTWSVTSPDPLEAGEEVTVVQTVDGEESDPVMATVNEAPTIDPIVAGDTEITGTGEPGSTITVTLPDGTELTTTVNPDGTWTVTLPDPLAPGDEVTVVQTIDGYEGDPVTETVSSPPGVSLNAKVFLGGPYDAVAGMMHDSLRVRGMIPFDQPYGGLSDFGYNGMETTSAPVLMATGPDAIVDWVMVELHDAADPTIVVARRAGLVQRDGDIVDVDGVSPLTFSDAVDGDYFIAVRHRNHLGVMTDAAVSMAAVPLTVDFTKSATGNYQLAGATGTAHAQQELAGGIRTLWPGNTSNSMVGGEHSGDRIIFQGLGAEEEAVYFDVLLDPANTDFLSVFISDAYSRSDADMNGEVIYQGGGADTDVTFFTVFLFPDNTLALPVFIIYEQIPK